MKKRKLQKGFTLVETLLFLGLSSVTALTLLFFLVNINRFNVSIRATRDIEQYGALALDEIKQIIQNAEYILTPDEITPSSTTITLKEKDANSLTEISFEDNQLYISQNGGSRNPFFPNAIEVDAAEFERLVESESSEGIRYEFSLSYDQTSGGTSTQEFDYSQTFSSTSTSQESTMIFPKSDLISWLKDIDQSVLRDDGQTLVYWFDKSGSGNNMYITDGQDAIVVNDELNEFPVIRMDGTNSDISGSLDIDDTAFTITIVINPTSISSGPSETFFELYGTDRVVLGVDDNTNNLRVFKDGEVLTTYPGAVNVGEFAIYTLTHSATQLTIHKNGEFVGSEAVSTGTVNLDAIILGNDQDGSDEFIGDIGEVLVFSRDLTGNEREQVESYLNAKYNLYGNLQ